MKNKVPDWITTSPIKIYLWVYMVTRLLLKISFLIIEINHPQTFLNLSLSYWKFVIGNWKLCTGILKASEFDLCFEISFLFQVLYNDAIIQFNISSDILYYKVDFYENTTKFYKFNSRKYIHPSKCGHKRQFDFEFLRICNWELIAFSWKYKSVWICSCFVISFSFQVHYYDAIISFIISSQILYQVFTKIPLDFINSIYWIFV